MKIIHDENPMNHAYYKGLSHHEIADLVVKIAACIDSGDSITVARKKILGKNNEGHARLVFMHPAYLEMINLYMIKVGKNSQYEIVKNKLRVKKRN